MGDRPLWPWGNSLSLCSYLRAARSCPGREDGRLFASRRDPHTGTASHRLASNHCSSGIPQVRDPTREDINPSLTHQLWLADLPHPELKPRQSRTEASLARRHRRDHAAGVCVSSHALNSHRLISLRRPRQGEDVSSSSRGNILPRSSARERERSSPRQQRFLKSWMLVSTSGEAVRLLSAIYVPYPRRTGSRDVRFWHNAARLAG